MTSWGSILKALSGLVIGWKLVSIYRGGGMLFLNLGFVLKFNFKFMLYKTFRFFSFSSSVIFISFFFCVFVLYLNGEIKSEYCILAFKIGFVIFKGASRFIFLVSFLDSSIIFFFFFDLGLS